MPWFTNNPQLFQKVAIVKRWGSGKRYFREKFTIIIKKIRINEFV